jgi:hypothetical protein
MTTYIIPSTYLYIKQHPVTGLKYFGKTTQDPLKYKGSGVHWSRHLKKHGRKYVITTNVFGPFTNSIAISEFALAFSRYNNIVESKDWANIEPENGLDGAPNGPRGKQQNPHGPRGPNGKKGIPTGPRGKQQNPSGDRAPRGPTGKQQNPSGPHGKQKNPAPEVECPHCGLVGRGGNMTRHHFDNCKMKVDYSMS